MRMIPPTYYTMQAFRSICTMVEELRGIFTKFHQELREAVEKSRK